MTSAFLLRSLGSQSRIGTNPRYISQEHSNISTPLNPCQITCSEFQISNRKWAFQVAQWLKNLPANAEDARDHSWDGNLQELNEHLSQLQVNLGFIKRINKLILNKWVNGYMNNSVVGILFPWLLGEPCWFFLPSSQGLRINPIKVPTSKRQMDS